MSSQNIRHQKLNWYLVMNSLGDRICTHSSAIRQWGTRSTNQSRYSSYMALWFVSYATSPITVTISDVSIVIVYGVTLLLSMTYHFQSRLGKTDCTDIWVIKLKNQVSDFGSPINIHVFITYLIEVSMICYILKDNRISLRSLFVLLTASEWFSG